MEMTYKEYIANPMGNGASVMSNREMYRNMYTAKFNALLVRENGKIDFAQFKDSKKGIFYFWVKIPSELVPNFYYDIVIEFKPSKNSNPSDTSLNSYNVRFFSNDPSFIFTFVYAFNKNGLFISEYASKIPRDALLTRATVKNPHVDTGYVKSLYFAYLVMDRRGLFSKIAWSGASPYNHQWMMSSIMHASEKIQLRQEEGALIQKQIRTEKKKQNAAIELKQNPNLINLSNFATSTIKHTATVGSTALSKISNKIKRIKRF